MARFVLIFLVCLGLGVLLVTTPAVKHLFSEPWGQMLAWVSQGIMSLWDDGVTRNGNVLSHATSAFAVSVDAECNGIDAVLVLWAAILAFPATLRAKLLGLAGGLIAVQALNLVRIISLYYIGQWNTNAFTWVHHNLWQGLMILGVLLIFLAWLHLLHARRHALAGGSVPPA
jgi:exosortase H (IPTLxxWG-CTERM-specific)